MHEFFVLTRNKNEILDITQEVKDILKKSKVKGGLCNVYVPHATCAVIINENYDPNVMDDILKSLANLIPEGKWKHDKVDNNAAAHIKSAIMGPSETIPVKNGEIQLGQWQDIMLCDFDGPRKRKVIISIIKG